jgi:molybdenum cofactor biosynthesis enzyme MoaA
MSQVEDNRRLNALEIRQGRTILASKPLQINFELIGICNIVPPCLYCTGKNLGYNYAPLDATYLDAYSNFIHAAEHLNEDSFGEPLLHKKLTSLAQEVTARGQRFSFVSNGLLLSGTRAEELAKCGERLGFHVSFNAATAETYHRLHGKPFEKIVANVRGYVELYRRLHDGKHPDLVATFIVMNVNRAEIFDFIELTQALGVKALFAQLHNRASIPIGDFGYHFVFADELLSPAEYFEVGASIRRYANGRGFDRNDIILQWDPIADFAVSSFKRQTEARPT